MNEPTVAAFHITGPTKPWPGRDVFLAAVKRAAELFVTHFRRHPTQDEIDLLAAAVARHYRAEDLLPAHLRQQ